MEINIFWLFVFIVIIIGTIILMAILILYLKQKALHKQTIKDHILIDLASLSGGFVVFQSSTIILREIIGPLQNEFLVESIIMLNMFFYFSIIACIISLQLSQVLLIFFSAEFNNWREDWVIKSQRLFVFTFSVSSQGLICSILGYPCHSTPLYYYFLQKNQDSEKAGQLQIYIIMSTMFALIIVICQTATEVKMFLVKREENRADQIAVVAFRKMEEALNKIKVLLPSGNNQVTFNLA